MFWGCDAKTTRRVQAIFASLLQQAVGERCSELDAVMSIRKQVDAYQLAAQGQVTAVQWCGNEIALQLSTPPTPSRRSLGTGAFAQWRLDALEDLTPVGTPRPDPGLFRLQRRAQQAGPCGIERIVPLRHALDFAPIWDGYDLLREFSR
ncbi:hypothetical protein GCM10007860_06570 [Chitiniphilus shinanonensis]|uniref:Uncharacterized protein n=1 Tax=Chitiniphilus shinanonensis TaxID=553088 RepID=A0ABQ6BUD7_9NEIS|nr:hypothetical protein [Chitiniphilus shinanonensis]GLS03513.1 hypothetical protein GCM10007860_06570 [Chitiniphilus shinanonensis]